MKCGALLAITAMVVGANPAFATADWCAKLRTLETTTASAQDRHAAIGVSKRPVECKKGLGRVGGEATCLITGDPRRQRVAPPFYEPYHVDFVSI